MKSWGFSIVKAKKGSFITLSEGDLAVTLSTYGAGVRNIKKKGVSLIYTPEDDEEYLDSPCLFGKFVAPFLGRIDGGKLPGGYALPVDELGYSKHSGLLSTAFKDFDYSIDKMAITFTRVQKAKKGICPGIAMEVRYCLEKGRLILKATLTPSSPYPLNPASHIYWTLGGKGAEELKVTIPSKKVSLFDDRMVEIGITEAVGPLDFTRGKPIKKDIASLTTPPTWGYDHCFHDLSGPILLKYRRQKIEIFSSCPNVNLYSDNRDRGNPRLGLAIEPLPGLGEIYDKSKPLIYEMTIIF